MAPILRSPTNNTIVEIFLKTKFCNSNNSQPSTNYDLIWKKKAKPNFRFCSCQTVFLLIFFSWDGDKESGCRRSSASWLLQLQPAVCSRGPEQPHLLQDSDHCEQKHIEEHKHLTTRHTNNDLYQPIPNKKSAAEQKVWLVILAAGILWI